VKCQPFFIRRIRSRAWMVALPCLIIGLSIRGVPAQDRQHAGQQDVAASSMAHHDMAHMAGHMYMTVLRPPQASDRHKADTLIAAAKAAMAPYQDSRKALADGYEIFLPNIPQPQYHFTKYAYALDARSHFDPLKPTSLLYKKTDDGGYKLVGAMYTDCVDATEHELNERIPLSIARWHQHINFCQAPPGQKAAYFGPDAKFGLRGSITTQEAVKQRRGSSTPMCLGGWFMSTRMRQVRRIFGRPMMTIRGTTTWIIPPCRA